MHPLMLGDFVARAWFGAKAEAETGDDKDDPNEHRRKPRSPPLLREKDRRCLVEYKDPEEICGQVDAESDQTYGEHSVLFFHCFWIVVKACESPNEKS